MLFTCKLFSRCYQLFFLAGFASLILGLFFSCGTKQNEGDLVAPEGMNILDLTKYGKPFALFVPDTSKAKLNINEHPSGALEIRVGETFGISINEQATDLQLAKSDVNGDEVNKLKSWLLDEPSAIMWESEIVHPEFHFYVNHKIGGADYSVEDIKDTEAKPFTKEQVQKMLDCAKSVKATKTENNS